MIASFFRSVAFAMALVHAGLGQDTEVFVLPAAGFGRWTLDKNHQCDLMYVSRSKGPRACSELLRRSCRRARRSRLRSAADRRANNSTGVPGSSPGFRGSGPISSATIPP